MRLLHLYGRTSSSTSPGSAGSAAALRRPAPRPARSSWAASPGPRGRSWTRIPRPGRSASGAGCRSGRRTGSPRRRPSSIRNRRLTGGPRGGLRAARRVQPRRSPEPRIPAGRAFGLLEAQVDGLEALWGAEPVLVRGSRTRSGRSSRAAPGGDRRDAVRGDGRGRRRGAGALVAVPRGRGGGLPRAAAGLPAHARTARSGRAWRGSGCGGSARWRSCRVGARGAVRRGGRADPGPRTGRGDGSRSARAAPRSGSGSACPWSRAVGGARTAPVRPPPARRRRSRDHLAARGAAAHGRHLRLELDLAFARAGHARRARRRAAPPRADRRRGGDRAAALRQDRADAAAGPGRPPGARAGRRRRRPPASSCRCSCRRRSGPPGSAGSSPGSR